MVPRVSPRPARVRVLGLFIALLTALVGASLSAAPAQAADFTISGRVTAADGTPIQGVRISVERGQLNADGTTTWVDVQIGGPATTIADGSYTTTVPAGTYKVGYQASGYVPVYYAGSSAPVTTRTDGSDVSVGPSQTLEPVALTLRNATIAGTVTNTAGEAMSGVRVDVYKLSVVADGTRTWSSVATGTTDASGHYSITVAPGSYHVGFQGASVFEPRYYPTATVIDEGADVVVGAGDTPSLTTVRMARLGRVTGRLFNRDGSVYTGTAQVQLARQVTYRDFDSTTSRSYWTTLPAVQLDNGIFSIAAPAGTYRIRVELPTLGAGYLPGMVGLDDGDDITVAPETAVGGLTYTLPAVGSISGQVIDATSGVGGASVRAYYRFVDDIRDGFPIEQWRTAPSGAVSGANGAYSLPAFVGRDYRVRATGTTAGTAYDVYWQNAASVAEATDVPLTSGAPSATGIVFSVGPGPFTIRNISAPWVSGAAASGSTLTAHTGGWDPASSALSVQWLADGAPIAGATGNTFTIPSTLGAGARYSIRVTATSPGRTAQTAVSQQTAPAAGILQSAVFENRLAPSVSGTPATGAVLTASPGQWSSTPSAYAYQWSADGAVIAGATQSTFTLLPAQLGKAITVKVTATSGADSASATSAPTAKVSAGPLVNKVPPTITGTPKVGEQLSATPGTWNVEGSTYDYQWLADGLAVPGATAATFTPTGAQAGSKLSVAVTATQTGFTSATAESAKTAAVQALPAPAVVTAPVISGSPEVGSPLTVSDGTWAPEPTSFAYQWSAGGVAVPGATSATFTPTSSQLGKTMSVVVTAKLADHPDGVAQVGPTAPVGEPIKVTGGPTIAGKARVGATLTANPGTVAPVNTTVGYEWLRAGEVIPAATGSSYTVTTADLGSPVSVRVTYSRAGSTDLVRTTAATAKIKSVPVIAVNPSVKGRTVALRVNISASGVNVVRGLVTVFEHGIQRRTATVSNGVANLKLNKVGRGVHRFVVKYRGDVLVAPGRATVQCHV